jgi:hypothetical protein
MRFILHTLFGRRTSDDRKNPLPAILVVFGVMSCIGACGSTVFVAPMLQRSGQAIAALPRPEVAELAQTAPGTRILLSVTLPGEPLVDGFAVYQREEQEGNSADWKTREVNPETIAGRVGAQEVSVYTNLNTRFTDSTLSTIDATAKTRTRGYNPRQTVTVQGDWTGDGLTALELYPGNIDAYIAYSTSEAPLSALRNSLICGVLGVLMLGGSFVLRLFRRVL